jgi:BirA family biotin operon repressor/biotin-[acetyl-CoA-carboxylase] ligase
MQAFQKNTTLPHCESTNDLAKELGRRNEPHGSWISSHCQTAGRGTFGKSWAGVQGNLFLSILLRPHSNQERLESLPLWSATVLQEKLGLEGFISQVKPPNDLMIEGRKCAGILCEAVRGNNPFVVVGIGLNCNYVPQGLNEACSLYQVTGTFVDPERFRQPLVDFFLIKFSQAKFD